MQYRLVETGKLPGEPRITVQRISVTGEPVDQRLIIAGRQRDACIRFTVGELRRRRPLAGLTPNPPAPRG